MAFQESLTEFLDNEQGFSIDAVVTPTLGKAYAIRGIISEEYFDIDVGTAGVSGSRPIFECPENEIIKVKYGDILTIRNQDYHIIEIRPDGTGWASLLLEKQNYEIGCTLEQL